MKTISTGLMAHLQQDVTTLCTCWLVTRADGVQIALTDFDQNLTIGGVTYQAGASYSRTAIKTSEMLEIDNLDVYGILDDSEITGSDILLGKYDYAIVQIAVYNWSNISQGPLIVRQGIFGECIVLPTGTFKVELRGLSQYLTTDTNNLYSPICRADLGDSKCKVPITPAAWQPNTFYAAGTYVSQPSPPDYIHRLGTYLCITPGISGPTAPGFDPTVGAVFGETSSPTVWQSVLPWRGINTVGSATNQKTFQCGTPLSYRANANYGSTATISVVGGAHAVNVRIQITHGTYTTIFDVPYEDTPLEAVAYLGGQINADPSLEMSASLNGQTVNITTSNTNVVSKIEILQQDSGGYYVTNFADGYLNGGLITWLTGLNAGASMEIYTYVQETETITLFLNMPFTISPGDAFIYQPGCSKTRNVCFYKFNNVFNFRGEPDAPGSDGFIVYPDSQQTSGSGSSAGPTYANNYGITLP